MEQRALSVENGRHVWRYLQSSVAEVDNSSKLEESKVQLEKSHGIKPSYIRLEPVQTTMK
jgi:hypothetical protein